jgi:predicted MFS family arabinose efflux permease
LPATRYWTDIGAFIRQKRWQGFLLGVFLFGTGMAVLNTYFVLFIDSLGAGEGLYGLSVVAASISELPVFLLSSVVLRRWAPRALLTFAFSALILRCFIYSALRDPWLAIPAQLLHGPSFAAMWAAGVAYVSRLSPEGLGASAQALFGATNFGVSGTAGALLGSQLYDTAGPVTLFQIAGLIVLGGMISFLITEFRYGQRAT